MNVVAETSGGRSITLPAPRTGGGLPLMEVLRRRHSGRAYSQRGLSTPLLSDLLWAAAGINRPGGGRTAPSAKSWQEVDVYAAMADGVFRYEPQAHRLLGILDGDIRAQTGLQAFVGLAPLNLIYVADLQRMDAEDAATQRFYAAADAGFIAQNVYLFCASEGLETVVRGLLNRRDLVQAMHLGAHQRVLLAQTVGYAAAPP